MPGDRDIDVVERALAHHEGLAGSTFFCGAAVVAHPSLQAVLGEVILDRGRREHRAGAEQVVATAMAVAAGGDLAPLGNTGFLAEAGKPVELAETGDDGPALAGLAHHSRRQ